MTSLRSTDGTAIDLGRLREQLVSDCESDVSNVEDVAGWSDTGYIVDSADDDVTSDESFSVTDINDDWVDISEDSSASAIDSCFVNVRSFADSDVTARLDDGFASRRTLGVEDEVIVIEEGSPFHNSDVEIDVSYLSENAGTELSQGEVPPDDGVGPWPIIQIESGWHESACESMEASETTHGDFQCTAVRIDENGFVHPIGKELDSVSDVDCSNIDDVVQDGSEDYIDVERICDAEDSRYEAHFAASSNLDEDFMSVTDWLFSIRHELLCETSADVSELNLPQASYVDTVTVNSSGAILHSQPPACTAVCPVQPESVPRSYQDEAVHGSSIVIESDVDVEKMDVNEAIPSIRQLSQFIEFIHNYCLPKSSRNVSPSGKEIVHIKRSRRRSKKQSGRTRSYKGSFKTNDLARWQLQREPDCQDNQRGVSKLKLKKMVNVQETEPSHRLDHNKKERLRRSKLAYCFQALQDVLSGDKSKDSKVNILSSAAKHIHKLEAQLASQYNELENLKARHHYLTSVQNRLKRKQAVIFS